MRRLHRKLARWLYHGGPRMMSLLRKRWVLLRNPQAEIRFVEPVYLGPRFSLHMPEGGTFVAGPGVEFRRGFRAELGGPRRGSRSAPGPIFTYDVRDAVLDVDHRRRARACSARRRSSSTATTASATSTRPMLQQGYDFTPLRIADDVTVTTKCTIIADIGERAFIGANSVVTRAVPPFCVAAGVPARVREYFGPPGGEPSPTDPPLPASG